MCYNIAFLEARAAKYEKRYQHILPPDWRPEQVQLEFPVYYFVSGFEHPYLPLVTAEGIDAYQWGLIPSWVKTSEQAEDLQNKTLNAVGETAFEKPSFRKSIASKRGLIGINGFYEWRDVKGVKYPYFIMLRKEEIFSLGTLIETWVDKSSGEIHKTFSIITTEANPMLEVIHNLKKRMPLIIDKEMEARWIDPDLTKEEVKSLIKPYDDKKMKAYTVSRSLNKVRTHRNTSDALTPVDYPELEE